MHSNMVNIYGTFGIMQDTLSIRNHAAVLMVGEFCIVPMLWNFGTVNWQKPVPQMMIMMMSGKDDNDDDAPLMAHGSHNSMP